MRRLVLLRHGQTAWNATGRAQGHRDIPLDEVGHQQAKAAASALAAYSPRLLWSSDLLRARETADHVAEETGLVPVLDARLREYAVGDNRMGLTLEEYAARFPAEHAHLEAGDTHLIPGRETDADTRARMAGVLTELAGLIEEGTTGVVVTHGAALRLGLAGFLDWPESVEDTVRVVANCAWAELEVTISRHNPVPLRWRLAAYNVRASDPDFASGPGVG
ncbi:putative Glucosyl-3-phosphoglycerate phosphatase [metagenome]|uniref:Putative Glucosyl-3-phosphoglycerate phosphatase n=1 Tax=metagenome TaxID=256318 RepID=A0A2P2C2F5_9ZZZZ